MALTREHNMADQFYLIEFNQNAENTLEMINIDLADPLTGIRRHKLLNFGTDDSGWRTIGWAPTQQEAHDLAERFLHQYYSNHPEKFPRTARSTSNLADECQSGYHPGLTILPRQTYKQPPTRLPDRLRFLGEDGFSPGPAGIPEKAARTFCPVQP